MLNNFIMFFENILLVINFTSIICSIFDEKKKTTSDQPS